MSNSTIVITYLHIILMDCLFPVESLPQIDFENTWNEDADQAARRGFYWFIWLTNIDEIQLVAFEVTMKGDNGSDGNETDEVPSKRKKT